MSAQHPMQALVNMLKVGGWMCVLLAGLCGWLAYVLALRTMELQQVQRSLWRHGRPDDSAALRQRMLLLRAPVLSQALITAAPLMGLLGTVGGMITTFSALAHGSATAPSSGIAEGISHALLTTQLGLSIALPGLFWQQLLRWWAGRMARRWHRSSTGDTSKAAVVETTGADDAVG